MARVTKRKKRNRNEERRRRRRAVEEKQAEDESGVTGQREGANRGLRVGEVYESVQLIERTATRTNTNESIQTQKPVRLVERSKKMLVMRRKWFRDEQPTKLV